jgi:hypothetical protein
MILGVSDDTFWLRTESEDLPNIPIGKLIQTILPDKSRYDLRIVSGAIVVASVHPRLDVLSRKIKRFTAPRTSIEVIAYDVLKRAIAPVEAIKYGSISSIIEGKNSSKVGPFNEKERTVEELMALIASQTQNPSIWVVYPPQQWYVLTFTQDETEDMQMVQTLMNTARSQITSETHQ